jgi:microcystin-dependent protein
MNNIIDQTTFTDDAVFDTTLVVAAGKLKVNAQGITSNELAANAVITTTVLDNAITNAKIATKDSFVPAGVVVSFAGVATGIPTGWLYCNGQAVSRTTYAALFAMISTTYGGGNGSTTFNVPDLRGAFVRGWDDTRGLDPSRGFGTYQADTFASHTHNSDPNLLRAYTGSISGTGGGSNYAPVAPSAQPTTATGGTETRPKNYALYYCIKY